MGPVAGVEAMTYSIAAAVQQAIHESATARQSAATGRRSSSRAHTVTTASAIPIANHAKYRGSHSPICECVPDWNTTAVKGTDSAA